MGEGAAPEVGTVGGGGGASPDVTTPRGLEEGRSSLEGRGTRRWCCPRRSSSRSPFEAGSQIRLSAGVVNYRLIGSPGDPLVVCIHGLGANISSFALVGPSLVKKGFRVLSYDLYGWGLSSAVRGKMGTRLYVAQLLELLEKVGPAGPVSIFGFCLGATVATEFALSYPSRVGRLLLVAPSGFAPRAEAPHQHLLFGVLRRGGWRGHSFMGFTRMAACCCALPARCSRKKELDFCMPDVRKPEEFTEQCRANTARVLWNLPRSVSSALKSLRDMPIWWEDFGDSYRSLAAGPTPVLFIWGTHDNVVPWDECRDVVVQLFGAGHTSCIMIKGAQHGLLLEPPDAQLVVSYATCWLQASHDAEWTKLLADTDLSKQGG